MRTQQNSRPVAKLARNRWGKAVADAKVPEVHFHDLRHTGNQFADDEGGTRGQARGLIAGTRTDGAYRARGGHGSSDDAAVREPY